MHMQATPYRSPRRSSSFRSVAVTRAPVAPSGWPSEIPPPFGFTSSIRSLSPVSAANWSTTDANASLTSITPTSSQPIPAFASAFAHACGLPWSIRVGSTPARPKETKRARGSSPRREQAPSLATSTAAEPSTICDEFPAVTTPSGRNAGLSAASASAEVSRRGASSTAQAAGAVATAVVRLERIGVDVVARELPLLRDQLRRDALRDDLEAVGDEVGEVAAVRAHRDARHHLDAGGDDDVELAGPDRGRGVEVRLQRRAALPVDRRRRHLDRPAGGHRRHAADVPALLADLGDASHLHVLDLARVQVGARDQPVQHLRRELVAANRRQRPVLPPDR